MTNNLPIIFQHAEIRSLSSGQIPGPWFPVIDLTKAWGLDRTTLFKHITRNKEDFADCSLLVDCPSTNEGMNETVLCVNEIGLYLLLSRISISRLKNSQAQTAIKAFRADLPKFLQQFRKGELIQEPSANIDLVKKLNEAKQIAELTGTDPKILQAAALRKLGYEEYAEALVPKGLIGIEQKKESWYNVTQLVQLCRDPLLTPERLNQYLHNNPKDPERRPFQYRDENRLWRLTELGKQYGTEYVYTASTLHQEIRITWKKEILVAAGLLKEV